MIVCVCVFEHELSAPDCNTPPPTPNPDYSEWIYATV